MSDGAAAGLHSIGGHHWRRADQSAAALCPLLSPLRSWEECACGWGQKRPAMLGALVPHTLSGSRCQPILGWPSVQFARSPPLRAHARTRLLSLPLNGRTDGRTLGLARILFLGQADERPNERATEQAGKWTNEVEKKTRKIMNNNNNNNTSKEKP